MINQKDIDYLRWIAQRLVNRYKEDPKISLDVDEILTRIISDISTHKMYSNSISQTIPICIKNLQDIIAYTNKLSSISNDTAKQITVNKNINTFETMNLSEIFNEKIS